MNHRLSTTISPDHWELLKKYLKQHKTQQKVLEAALDNLDNNLQHEQKLSPDDKLWLRLGRDMGRFLFFHHKNYLPVFLEGADIMELEKMTSIMKPAEHMIEWLYEKPLKKCTLIEVIEGIIIISRIANVIETINYSDKGSHYFLNITHNLKFKGSQLHKLFYEDLFVSYGAKVESEISESGIYIKINKK